MIRSVLVTAAILIGLRYAVRGPFYALLFYLWLAFFHPEKWLWYDFVTDLKLSYVVGLFFVISTILSSERLRGGLGPLLILAFLGESMLSSFLSPIPQETVGRWQNFAPVMVIAFFMAGLVSDERRLRLVLMTIALSLGVEGAKQGWATFFLYPGAANKNPWPNLGDNNGVAVGMLMIVPVLTALAATAGKIERYVERFVAVGVIYRAVSTYSRGGFVALGALTGHFLLRSKHKLAIAVSIVAMWVAISSVLPQSFWDRMNTISEAAEDPSDSDASIQGRLYFWEVGVRMANDYPLLGIGLSGYNGMYDRFDISNGKYGRRRSVHSVWFGVLAELGYTGFTIFVVLLVMGFLACRRVRRLAKKHIELANLARYATALEASLLVFVVGGSFLPFQYSDLYWDFLTLTLVIDRLAKERIAALVRHNMDSATSNAAATTSAVAASTFARRSARGF